MKHLILACLLCGAAPLVQAQCPPPQDHSERMSDLITAIKIAPDARAAQIISNKMWDLWDDAPDAEAQRMLDDGLARRAGHDFNGALKAFELLVAYCPDYAEGYNQRAFIRFIQQDYAPALTDLERAITLSPTHIAAISGKALTLMGLKRDDEAQTVLREALALNPWLKERRFLTGDAPATETDL
ncbi:tetratricopeptide repeat protein [Planktotalea arctica]|uniref:tetratricopeptide repeat protein n=1 Tax=Planktotalea arctica TaxID=1481893 RepID=UPI000A171EE8|nr:tetratricopeptide repeat protein [Planktotalea arctica]